MSALDYIRKLYAPQDTLLAAIDATLNERGIAIHINPEEGKLIQMFMTLHRIRTVVEIGTLAGYSAIWMARALPEDGHLYTIDREPAHIEMAKEFIGRSDVKDRITQLEGDAHDVLATLAAKGPFDMVFIDADKLSYNDYLDWAEANVKKLGMIIADNTFLFDTIWLKEPPEGTAPATWHAMQLFNERLADTEKYFTAMIPTDDGLTVAVKLF